MGITKASEDPAADAAAAHDFLSELRTRITTQPLHYQHGAEARALESLWEAFGQARTAMKKYPGCARFSAAVTRMLNLELRPLTAKWDRAHGEGRLDSRDGADEFRADLADLQAKLRKFVGTLQDMAYRSTAPDDLTPPVMTEPELNDLCNDVAFGLAKGSLVPDDMVDSINADEGREVAARRAVHGIKTTPGMSAVGVGLSGGGIRSATFCLGVMQVLAERGMLKDVDFLSTVSGGGYTGSFLTTRLGAGWEQGDVASPHGPDPVPIRYLRHHAKYLTAVDLKQSWSMVTATLAGMLLNWTAPVLLIVLAALAATGVAMFSPGARGWPISLAVSAALAALALVLYGWLIRQGPRLARNGGWLLGLMVGLTVLIGVGWLLSVVYGALPHLAQLGMTLSGVLVALAAAGPAILRFVPVVETPAVRRIVLKALLALAGLVVPLASLALFYAAFHLGSLDMIPDAPWWTPLHYLKGAGILAIAAAVLGVVAIFLLNINLTGPHRLYRDLLAATFAKGSEDDDAVILLKDINPIHRAPYHLINATVNLPSSTDSALRDRKSDFFLFSKHWCGSPVIHYRKTTEWKTNASEPDLATAMAVSGAAASSHMGLGSMPTLIALLTFLNVRLGFWIRRPGHDGFPQVPGFICLIREMTGIAMSEKQAWINLSDGGHIENMAIYELLRRRCKYVVCVDGEADPTFTFQGLMTLVRHAQLDFGIRVEPRLNDMRPDSKSSRSQTHTLLCRIHYPDASDGRPAAMGLLLYLKLSITGNESELIKRYRIICPDFPHQTTLDQFFGEEQFEAYRQLGVHVAEGLFSRVLMNGIDPPRDVADWFRRLAGNLLEPELGPRPPARH